MADDFATFLKRREAISNDYINGDAKPLDEIVTRTDPASFMPPSGMVISGAEAVAAAHLKGAAAFQKGSTGRFEILDSGSDGSIGYWAGTQPAKVMMKGKDEPVAMTLRVTEIFRKEGGEWKLVHRHADMMQSD